MAALTEISLFTGAGGGLLGGILNGWQPVCYVERETYCVEVLKARIRDGYIPDAPIWDDVRTFDGTPWRGCVDLVSAGFPCQPFSVAGKGRADADERNGWPDTIRIIRSVEPRWVFLENVPGLLAGSHGYFGRVLGDLAESGFRVRWDCIPASALGAPHRRDRLWIVGEDASKDSVRFRCVHGGNGKEGSTIRGQREFSSGSCDGLHSKKGVGPDTDRRRCSRERVKEHREQQRTCGCEPDRLCEGGRGQGEAKPWPTEPDVGRVVDGLAPKLDVSGSDEE